MVRNLSIFCILLSIFIFGCEKDQNKGPSEAGAADEKSGLQEKEVRNADGKVFALETTNKRGEKVKFVWLYQNGKPYIEASFKNNLKHGSEKRYSEDGKLEFEGEWRDDKPWNGWCYILQAGDAGSWGGLRYWRYFEEGKQVEKRKEK